MPKPRNDLIDRLQYLALRLAAMAMHCWPIEVNLSVARALGDLIYTIDKKHRDRALHNLRRGFPHLPEARIQGLARRQGLVPADPTQTTYVRLRPGSR